MKFLKFLFILFILSIIALGGVSYWLFDSLNKPHQHSKSNQFIQIEKGTTPNEIVDKLAAEGVLDNPFAAQIYLRTFGDASKLKAGDYQFNSPITALQVLKELEKGEERTIKLTIPEGWTRFDIAKRVAEKFPTNPPMDEKAVLYLMNDVSLIKDFDPTAKNLEGYMYPSTYSFPIGTEPKDVIKRMVDQFKKTLETRMERKSQSSRQNTTRNCNNCVLIETESKFDGERQIVSSVIYNRLNKNIALGIDQTAVYIAKMENRWDGTINKSRPGIKFTLQHAKICRNSARTDFFAIRIGNRSRAQSAKNRLFILCPQRRKKRRFAQFLCVRRRI